MQRRHALSSRRLAARAWRACAPAALALGNVAPVLAADAPTKPPTANAYVRYEQVARTKDGEGHAWRNFMLLYRQCVGVRELVYKLPPDGQPDLNRIQRELDTATVEVFYTPQRAARYETRVLYTITGSRRKPPACSEIERKEVRRAQIFRDGRRYAVDLNTGSVIVSDAAPAFTARPWLLADKLTGAEQRLGVTCTPLQATQAPLAMRLEEGCVWDAYGGVMYLDTLPLFLHRRTAQLDGQIFVTQTAVEVRADAVIDPAVFDVAGLSSSKAK